MAQHRAKIHFLFAIKAQKELVINLKEVELFKNR